MAKGMESVLLENLQSKAQELGCEQLTLLAAARGQAHLFSGDGFNVEDSDMAYRDGGWLRDSDGAGRISE